MHSSSRYIPFAFIRRNKMSVDYNTYVGCYFRLTNIKTKDIYGDSEEWVDYMCRINVDEEELILIPNRKNSGQLINIDVINSDLEVMDITQEKIDECFVKFREYDKYKDWLVKQRKFIVIAHFGLISYCS
jgi:hypothetical protein